MKEAKAEREARMKALMEEEELERKALLAEEAATAEPVIPMLKAIVHEEGHEGGEEEGREGGEDSVSASVLGPSREEVLARLARIDSSEEGEMI